MGEGQVYSRFFIINGNQLTVKELSQSCNQYFAYEGSQLAEDITPGDPAVVEVAQHATDADVCELRPVTWQDVINTVNI